MTPEHKVQKIKTDTKIRLMPPNMPTNTFTLALLYSSSMPGFRTHHSLVQPLSEPRTFSQSASTTTAGSLRVLSNSRATRFFSRRYFFRWSLYDSLRESGKLCKRRKVWASTFTTRIEQHTMLWGRNLMPGFDMPSLMKENCKSSV